MCFKVVLEGITLISMKSEIRDFKGAKNTLTFLGHLGESESYLTLPFETALQAIFTIK